MSRKTSRSMRLAGTAMALMGLAGCAGTQSADRAAVEIRGTAPSASVAAAAAPVVDADGIVTYDGYQAAVARSGDTVASVAGRIGLSATELGAYNGLQASHPLREGDELVLPQRPGGYGAAPAPQPAAPAPAYQPYAAPQAAGAVSSIELAPLPGTAPAAPAPQPAPTAPAASGGAWSPDLAAAAIARSTGIDQQGNLALPPSAAEPLPPDPQVPGTLNPPQLNQYQTPAPTPRPVEVIAPSEESAPEPETVPQPSLAAAAPVEPVPLPRAVEPAPAAAPKVAATGGALRLIQPVHGPVVVGFRQGGGRAGNDGIDYAAPASSPVVAAADGEVALVSKSLGGLGNIVLVRHPDDYLTVYGRIEGVTVNKGDIVRQGQKIGVVAAVSQPRMHFEVRRGAESLDPELFF